MDKDSSIKQQNRLTRVVCTFVFSLFVFFFLYYYQADLLTVMQHVFSKGQTHYNHFIGAVLITLVLLIVQVCVVRLFRKMQMAWAFTFVPSALFLILLTDVHPSENDGLLVFGKWVYLCPIALAIYALLAWGSYASGFTVALHKMSKGWARQLWTNILILFLIILMVCCCSFGDKSYHARIHVEQLLTDGDVDGALRVLAHHSGEDENMTMLTAYALSRKRTLAEDLFEYKLCGDSRSLMPYGTKVKFEMFPDSTFYNYLGGWYVQRMSTMRYLNYQLRHKRMNKVAADYLLCGYLMDRNLDAFVSNIGKYYTVNDSVALPKHYREALLLYTHLHSNPSIIYNNSVMNADFQDYQQLEDSIADKFERKTKLRDTYGNTYWYYYQYR